MNKRQQNHLKMFRAIASVFNSSESSWRHLEPVQESYTEFKTALQILERNAQHEQSSTQTPLAPVYLQSVFGLCRESVEILDDLVKGLVDDLQFKEDYKRVRRRQERGTLKGELQ
ncbi:hypothetical protein [Pedobacter sp. SYSU D00535]|uniref:hypothetical protein n=1 Tax=Pedobacter sp. SYSU D00535 TaxID=2810308 RepID=UPI001A9669B6|nr:hypothetical protein [Pedobacter sp. SYSU D00535]